MNQSERIKVGEMWAGLANMYGKEINRAAMNLMLNAISDLDARDVLGALNEWASRSKLARHPFPAEIREKVCPSENISAEAQAREIAARICGAIPKFGWINPHDARNHIGAIGWRIVERQGGWQYLCENMGVNINPGIFQAQLRDQLLANIQYGPAALEASIHGLSESENGLTQIGNIVKRLVSQIKTVPSTEDEQRPS